ncbi:PAQR family membrane homeostasis protein TrhA [Rarobacter incanus]|uniref:Hemolysin III n=1 Tax=Rarobacter incanus TaxID=153494 RepID=A0A542SNW2_9MICO|nr:hemolysin III family protein [Rarobacter incanus]TQK76272.1 hemolysin III [Rarobacter incanus]
MTPTSGVSDLKPRLRGWLHAGAAPLALAAGIVLVCLTPTVPGKLASATFALASVMLFATSATYHLGRWSVRTKAVLRRLDHSNIFLLIAGTYTPLAVLLLDRRNCIILLSIVWAGAIAGLLARVLWLTAPRWLYVPIYVALGWVAVAYLPSFWRTGGPAVVWLVVAGGLAYTLGAVVYGFKKPNPSPTWFGFHEVFHSLTLAAFACHCTAIMIAATTVTAAAR